MTFDETYPRYPFSVLVGLGVAAAKAFLRVRATLVATRADRRVILERGRPQFGS